MVKLITEKVTIGEGELEIAFLYFPQVETLLKESGRGCFCTPTAYY